MTDTPSSVVEHSIDMRDVLDWDATVIDLDQQIVHFDEETRVRVFSGQLQDEVIRNINRRNYHFHVNMYFKIGYQLRGRFSGSDAKITEALKTFWQRVQMLLKEDGNGVGKK